MDGTGSESDAFFVYLTQTRNIDTARNFQKIKLLQGLAGANLFVSSMLRTVTIT